MTAEQDREREKERERARAAHPSAGRIVVSSLTGAPMAWGEPAPSRRRSAEREDTPVLPDRMVDEQPEAGVDESNDERLRRDVPPHWGTGA